MPVMHLRLALLPTLLFSCLFSTTLAANFTFDFGTPTQCDNFPISWTGGSPPFELVLAPEFGTPRTFSVPSASFTNGQGSFQAQIPFLKGHSFIAIMSDATGFGSGGVTDVLTVGSSVSNTNCNTTDPGVDFFFELNTALQQCRPYTFDNYTGAVQPVTITGVIPGGETFVLNPPTGPTTYEWIANLADGVSVMWIMSDSQGRKGGSSDVKVVGATDDKTCLNADSPTSLSVIPSATASASATSSHDASATSGSDSASGGSSKSSSDTGAIIGGVLAGLFAIATIIALVLFFLRRRRNRSTAFYEGDEYPRRSRRGGRLESVDLDPPAAMEDGHAASVIHPYPYSASVGSQSLPGGGTSTYNMAASAHQLLPMGANAQRDGQTQYDTNLTNPYSAPSESAYSRHHPSGSVGGMSAGDRTSTFQGIETASMTSSARRKAAMAGETTYRPTRFIVHQDLEEAVPQDEGDVVELPPQYSESRTPLHALKYVAPPPGSPPRGANPLEAEEADSSNHLQEPLQPATPTMPTSPAYRS